MKLLLDTHILLWAAQNSPRLSPQTRQLLETPEHLLMFSVVSLWEVAIKHVLQRSDFHANPHALRCGLLENGYVELAITGEHALALSHLPPLHNDPFDRMLLAQSLHEGIPLLTADAQMANYRPHVDGLLLA